MNILSLAQDRLCYKIYVLKVHDGYSPQVYMKYCPGHECSHIVFPVKATTLLDEDGYCAVCCSKLWFAFVFKLWLSSLQIHSPQ